MWTGSGSKVPFLNFGTLFPVADRLPTGARVPKNLCFLLSANGRKATPEVMLLLVSRRGLMNVEETVNSIEAVGVTFRIDGGKVRVRYSDESQREELCQQIALLRANKDKVAAFLQARATIPTMPPGVRLIEWNLKEPPVAIETCAVVTDSALFARSTLEQLRKALAQPTRWVGWSIPQLIDRLAQVGVTVALESKPGQSTARAAGRGTQRSDLATRQGEG
jgi:hypothetical protein